MTSSAMLGAHAPIARSFSGGGGKDYYKILGIDKSADGKAIKTAYRKRALETHPDQGGNKEEFAEVAEAYEVLSSPEKKQVYDQYGSEAANNHGANGMGGFGGGRSAEDIFAEFFNGFGGFGGGRPATPTVEPAEVQLPLTLEMVFQGVTKSVKVRRPQVCPECTGFGTKSKTEKPACSQCKGSGHVVQHVRMGPGMVQQSVAPCPRCTGTGSTAKPEDRCTKCHGNGFCKVTDTVTVQIPPGVPSNVTLVVRGEGGTMPKAAPGDLHVHVEVAPHPVFQRRGNDLVVHKEVTLAEALLGLHMPLKLLDGRTVYVETPSHTVLKTDGVIKIPGEGMHGNTGGRGDIYIFTQLQMPAKVTAEQKELIEKAFGAPQPDANASAGNTVKARVLRETKEQLEEKKRGVWASQDNYTDGRRKRSSGDPRHTECAAQ